VNFYIQEKGETRGPFPEDDLRERIYSGALPRLALGCPEGGTEWVPLESLLSQRKSPTSAAVTPVSLERLRDPEEKTTLAWLYIASVPAWLFLLFWTVWSYGALLIIIGFIMLIKAIGEMWFFAHLKTNAVRVSETQLPELFAIVQKSCHTLGMERPEVYVMQQNVWNSFATKVFKRRVIVLLSGAVDSILLKGDMQELSWLVGHELGHHWAGHLNWSQRLAKAGDWLIWLALWHSRRAELTCDRVGLYCAGSLKASQRALVNATVGAQLAGKVNLEEASNQWQQHRGEFFVKYRAFYATHPHLLARLDHLNAVAAEFGMNG
jgi:Zn-dependent protease with chaperone function